jgi:uncharacterized membrane protein YgcG
MRTLLPHSLLALVLAAHLGAAASVTVPSSIGNLSDYGAVFDRHGRDEVNASISQISQLLRIDVYVLVSWENSFPTTDQFADAVFSAWGLSPRRTILAVFVRTGSDWTDAVRASTSVRTELGAIDQRLQQRMADLVRHRRIEEAVRSLFTELRGLPAAQRASAALARTQTSSSRGAPVALVIGGSLGGVLALAVLIRWRICPRCAGLLRRERARYGSLGSRRAVYSCRRCGHRRGG